MSPDTLIDGDWSRPSPIGPKRKTYPFRQNGDRVTLGFMEDYWQTESTFTPQEFSIPYSAALGDFYLIKETDPTPLIANLLAFSRLYSRVPATQTVQKSIMVNRPGMPSGSFPMVFGAYRLFQPDTTLLQYDAYAYQAVVGDSGAPAFYPTGGTYTLTFAGSTTAAINYNASAATVQTAVNLLTNVSDRGGLVVSGTYNSAGGFTFTWAAYAAMSADTSLLTTGGGGSINYSGTQTTNGGYIQFVSWFAYLFPSTQAVSGGTYTLTIFGQTTSALAYNASSATVTAALNALTEVQKRGNCTAIFAVSSNYINSVTVTFTNAAWTGDGTSATPLSSIAGTTADFGIGQIETVKLIASTATRTITAIAHGIAASDTIYLKASSTYYPAISGNLTVLSADTLAITVSASATYAGAGTFTEIGKRTKHNYIPGSAPTVVNAVTQFSLTAITPGAYQGGGDVFLQAIFAGNTAINYQVGDSARWPDDKSVIQSLTTIQVSAANL